MATFSSIKQFKQKMRDRLRRMKMNSKAQEREAMVDMWANARNNAPLGSGKLKASIQTSERKNGSYVIAGYSTTLRRGVARFTNQEFAITGRFPYYKDGSKVVYGKNAQSPKGNAINWTAIQNPWWDKAVRQTQRKYRKVIVRNVSKAFRD